MAIGPAGRAIVDEVTARRRTELTDILDRLQPTQHAALIEAFGAFADAAGEDTVEEALILGL